MPPKPNRKPKFAVDYSKLVSSQGNSLSPASIAIYKAALNRIAATGYRDKDDLLKCQNSVVKVIEDEFPTAAKRRVALSAVFRVLQDIPLEKKQAYYECFQRAKTFPEEKGDDTEASASDA